LKDFEEHSKTKTGMVATQGCDQLSFWGQECKMLDEVVKCPVLDWLT
jgi:hypothetical protein